MAEATGIKCEEFDKTYAPLVDGQYRMAGGTASHKLFE